MDPNQTPPPQDGSTPAPADPAAQTAPPVDPAGQQAPPASPVGTDTGTSFTTTDTSGQTVATTLDTTPRFLGVPTDALMVGGPIFLAGLLLFAYLTGRSGHTEQLSRLDKQRKRFEAKESAKPEAIDIFLKTEEDMLGKLLSQAGLESQYVKYKGRWILTILGTTCGMAIFCFIPQTGAAALAPFSIILGPGLGSFGFIQYLKYLASDRQKKLTVQLPGVLESMVSTLKAGSPVVECFKLLSETAPEPIRSEFRRALVSLQLGKPFREVLAEMGTRIRTPDFRLLTQAIFISQDVGANLADVVATIAEAIRERFRLRDFLAALTAQGKMTAMFIGALPYFITGMTYVITPGYITPFLNHPIARIVFIGLMIWEAIGAWILVKMTTFEV
ncbi:MAG: type II secretion system F family protein [Candidatus Obscuribacterales bacterium]|nr:type II secretion system F family protein [Candidatus Obscuribacterales bacterium]